MLLTILVVTQLLYMWIAGVDDGDCGSWLWIINLIKDLDGASPGAVAVCSILVA
jgi:hypothetical protein